MKKSALHDEVIARDAGGQSWWSLPPEDLRPWVVAFIGRQDLGMRQRFTIFPNAQAELFFHFGSPYLTNRRLEEPLEALATASLFAPKLECNEHQCGPCVDWFLIQLTPAGCRALLGHPVGALLQRDLPLTAFWGDEALDLQAQLAEKHDFKARVDTGSAWLLRRRIASGDRGDLAISRICNRSRAVPVATVADAAAQSSLGVRRFRDRFSVEMGIAPKAWLSLMRAERLWTALHPSAPASTDLFAEFADESHACREFKRTTGMTIAEYRAIKRSGDGLINGGSRRLVSDV